MASFSCHVVGVAKRARLERIVMPRPRPTPAPADPEALQIARRGKRVAKRETAKWRGPQIDRQRTAEKSAYAGAAEYCHESRSSA